MKLCFSFIPLAYIKGDVTEGKKSKYIGPKAYGVEFLGSFLLTVAVCFLVSRGHPQKNELQRGNFQPGSEGSLGEPVRRDDPPNFNINDYTQTVPGMFSYNHEPLRWEKYLIVSLLYGFLVMLLSSTSGAHFNPAVTFSHWLMTRLKRPPEAFTLGSMLKWFFWAGSGPPENFDSIHTTIYMTSQYIGSNLGVFIFSQVRRPLWSFSVPSNIWIFPFLVETLSAGLLVYGSLRLETLQSCYYNNLCFKLYNGLCAFSLMLLCAYIGGGVSVSNPAIASSIFSASEGIFFLIKIDKVVRFLPYWCGPYFAASLACFGYAVFSTKTHRKNHFVSRFMAVLRADEPQFIPQRFSAPLNLLQSTAVPKKKDRLGFFKNLPKRFLTPEVGDEVCPLLEPL